MAQEHVHEGRNIRRFRELLGVKQESLAANLGSDWTQKKISQLESKYKIEPEILQEVSAVLKIPVEAIQNFDEEQAVNIISNTFNDAVQTVGNNSGSFHYQPVLNPIEKWIEALEENKKLYERLLQTEREKTDLVQGMLDKLK